MFNNNHINHCNYLLTENNKEVCVMFTVDTARLIAVVGAVVNFIALFGAVDAGAVAALELVGSTREQGCRTYTTQRCTQTLAKKYLFLGCK